MDDKIMVQRANVVLDISPEQLDYYMSQGYDVINDRGDVVQASVPRDLGTLQKLYTEHTEEIKQLKAEVEKLQTKLAEKEAEVAEKEAEGADKPKRQRKKSE